jgi:hypothetical protein
MVAGAAGVKSHSPLPEVPRGGPLAASLQDDGGVEVPITEMSPPRTFSPASVMPSSGPAAAPALGAAAAPEALVAAAAGLTGGASPQQQQQWQQLSSPQQQQWHQGQAAVPGLWPSPPLQQQQQPQKLPFQQVSSRTQQQQQQLQEHKCGQGLAREGVLLLQQQQQQQLWPGRDTVGLASQQQQQQGMLSTGGGALTPGRSLPPRPPEPSGGAAVATGNEQAGNESGRRRSSRAKAPAAPANAGGGGGAGAASRCSSPQVVSEATAAAAAAATGADEEGTIGRGGEKGGSGRSLRSRDGSRKKPGTYAEFDKDTEEEEEEEEAAQDGSESEAEQQPWMSALDLTTEGAAQEGGVHGGVAGTRLLWWRTLAQRSVGIAMLPRDMTRRLARKGGRASPGQGVRWKSGKPLPQLSPRLRWITAVQRCSSTAQLALQMRVLDTLINWEALKRPNTEAADPEWFHASVTSRRRAPEALGGNEYLVVRPYDTGYPWGVVAASK